MLPDLQGTLERLFTRSNAHHRVASVLASLSGLQRISGRPVVRLDREIMSYPMRDRPNLEDMAPLASDAVDDTGRPERGMTGDRRPTVTRHREMKVLSVIDIHSWNEATWTGVAYAQYRQDSPPILALFFQHPAPTRRIFERWRDRFGTVDVNHDISC